MNSLPVRVLFFIPPPHQILPHENNEILLYFPQLRKTSRDCGYFYMKRTIIFVHVNKRCYRGFPLYKTVWEIKTILNIYPHQIISHLKISLKTKIRTLLEASVNLQPCPKWWHVKINHWSELKDRVKK